MPTIFQFGVKAPDLPVSTTRRGLMLPEDKTKLDALFLTLPSCRLHNSTNLAIPNAVGTALTFDTEYWDTHGFHSTMTNPNRITIPTAALAGTYLVGASAVFANAAGGGRRIIYLSAVGTPYAYNEAAPTAAAFPGFTPVMLIGLAAGQYVEVSAYQDSGAALNVQTLAQDSPEFWAIRLGGV